MCYYYYGRRIAANALNASNCRPLRKKTPQNSAKNTRGCIADDPLWKPQYLISSKLFVVISHHRRWRRESKCAFVKLGRKDRIIFCSAKFGSLQWREKRWMERVFVLSAPIKRSNKAYQVFLLFQQLFVVVSKSNSVAKKHKFRNILATLDTGAA